MPLRRFLTSCCMPRSALSRSRASRLQASETSIQGACTGQQPSIFRSRGRLSLWVRMHTGRTARACLQFGRQGPFRMLCPCASRHKVSQSRPQSSTCLSWPAAPSCPTTASQRPRASSAPAADSRSSAVMRLRAGSLETQAVMTELHSPALVHIAACGNLNGAACTRMGVACVAACGNFKCAACARMGVACASTDFCHDDSAVLELHAWHCHHAAWRVMAAACGRR